MSKYFDKFPVIQYNDDIVRNILARVNVYEQSRGLDYQYYDYTLTDDVLRPDLLSENYYRTPDFDWVFYLVNKTVDPYYGFYIREKEFENYIISKYFTVEEAQRTILFYRNNWPLFDGTTIPLNIYEGLDPAIQKYYHPVLDASFNIYEYKRIEEDWIRSTNVILSLKIKTYGSATIGTIVRQGTARGTVCGFDTENDCILVQHVTGVFQPGELETGEVVSEIQIIAQPIPEAEAGFWSPVTAYEHEVEQNELKKQINVLPDTLLSKFESDFHTLIRS